MTAALVLALAAILDATLGEPPNALHPVVWIGTAIGWATRVSPMRGRAAPFLAGLTIAVVLPAGAAALTWALLRALEPLPVIRALVSVLLLKSTFSLRALGEAARVVRDALVRGDLLGARRELRSLCSRDASELDPPLISAAVIESIAENASDSLVAPVLYYALFGLPGAVFYRAVNTLDAMIGYRGRYEWIGKASARLDDALNFLPARLTAALLLLAGALYRLDVRGALRILVRDGRRTESPNAGRPMAAMAGLLRVQLEKRGAYALGDPTDAVHPTKIDDAWRVTRAGGWLALAGAAAALGVSHGR
jgi:adenosylcobinamide-phosphate synthase